MKLDSHFGLRRPYVILSVAIERSEDRLAKDLLNLDADYQQLTIGPSLRSG
jgi:hypothetical protein